ncbi:NADPH-glutathione reductase [Roseiarcus fermentans]|uniref:Glutathione reductase n=1 Tax=Roseiarcus fermentans TaxID=1473586 RepID=A0A366FLK4_9HYPH|nr:glutathione-disulfide reductase [Roseiarcus fermentans]RBP15583.1 NADPH-glutathione reductase [Roseiarcus fermentans]
MTGVSSFPVDLFVIGAGSGGVRAARIAAGHGARVMIAEEFRIGGTCVIRGCVPKKLLVYASRFADDFCDARGYGWNVGETSFDWLAMVAAKEKEISRLSAIYRENLEKAGVDLVEERAEIAAPRSVRLASGRVINAKHILIASGATPELAPSIPGLEHAITSNEIFDLKSFPKRLMIVGGGYIAVEFASLFAKLGAKVTQVMRASNILRGFDEDMRVGLAEELGHSGVTFATGCLPTRIEKRAGALDVALSNGDNLVVDQVLIATGRRPNTAKLGLESVGVATDAHGAVKVDDGSTTNVATIHAVGDVTNRINLTPVAIREGQAFADRVFGGKPGLVDHDCVPSAVFTTPEIGTVGLTEALARERYQVVDIYRSRFRPLKAAVSGRSERTVMKIVVDGTSDQILGAHILGHEAGEMIQLLAIAVKMKATKADLDATMAVHPTAAEELVTMRTRTARFIHERD